jgi:hypothetical protein
MAGLVAAGTVLVGYTLLNWGWARVRAQYAPPAWWRVWLVSALPVGGGIVLITTSVNWPTLPLSLAVWCAIVALAGLALALMPGTLAAQQPWRLFWLAVIGAGLVPGLLLIRAIELPARGLISAPVAYAAAIGGTLFGAGWLLATRWLQQRLQPLRLSAWELLLAGLAHTYLLLPLVHHLGTPAQYRYISVAENFFATTPAVQAVQWGVAIALAFLGAYCCNEHTKK